VIPTRNRGPRIVTAIESVLACDGPAFDLSIVDQSSDDRTEQAVAPFLSSGRVRYLKTRTTGVATARNLGIQSARTALVAFTDDDCTVAPGWLAALTELFVTFPRVAIVFGNVLAGPHDPETSFVVSYRREGAFLGRSLRDKHRLDGIGGCMALRRSAWAALEGFDEMLGTGSRFRSAEELDFAIRALQTGFFVYETDRAAVSHHGARDRADRERIAYDYLYGIGAVYSKHLKCRRWSVLGPLASLARRWTLGGPVVDYGTPPSRAVRLKGFLDGFLAGAASPVVAGKALYANDAMIKVKESSR
jgi:glycosyltransferase involved in cell wall biosynthesis